MGNPRLKRNTMVVANGVVVYTGSPEARSFRNSMKLDANGCAIYIGGSEERNCLNPGWKPSQFVRKRWEPPKKKARAVTAEQKAKRAIARATKKAKQIELAKATAVAVGLTSDVSRVVELAHLDYVL